MKKIGIIPSIKETYKNQFEFSYDIKINNILKSIYKKVKIYNLDFNTNINSKIDLIIICGGNDLPFLKKNKANLFRYNLSNTIFKKALKKNIPMLGICYGAQFLAHKFKSKFKNKKHVGDHKIYLKNEKIFIKVNSYHNTIISHLGKKLIVKGMAEDRSIEYFTHKNKKIIGIQWHPERYKKIKKIDIKILNSICS